MRTVVAKEEACGVIVRKGGGGAPEHAADEAAVMVPAMSSEPRVLLVCGAWKQGTLTLGFYEGLKEGSIKPVEAEGGNKSGEEGGGREGGRRGTSTDASFRSCERRRCLTSARRMLSERLDCRNRLNKLKSNPGEGGGGNQSIRWKAQETRVGGEGRGGGVLPCLPT